MSKKLKELEDMIEVLSLSIGRKQGCVRFFEDALQKTSSDEFRKVLNHLINEEKSCEGKLRVVMDDLESRVSSEKKK